MFTNDLIDILADDHSKPNWIFFNKFMNIQSLSKKIKEFIKSIVDSPKDYTQWHIFVLKEDNNDLQTQISAKLSFHKINITINNFTDNDNIVSFQIKKDLNLVSIDFVINLIKGIQGVKHVYYK